MYLNGLTLEEKVGKLFILPVCPPQGEKHLESVAKLLKERHIGGVIFMSGTKKEQLQALKFLEDACGHSFLTFQDAEWGAGMRLSDIPSLPKNLTLGAIQNLELLRAFGREVARQCRLAGVIANFAPVVDINTNPRNPVIGRRSFGDDPEEVAWRGLAVMQGMREGGIFACAKHFPGHGDTAIDSHYSLPCIDKSLEEIAREELIPFRSLIAAGVDMVMIGHLYYPALSSLPSSLSYEIMTKLLREELGFKGVIVTDSLAMCALSLFDSPEEVARKALLAGADLLLSADSEKVEDLLSAIPKIFDHVCATIPEELIDKKLERIQSLDPRKLSKIAKKSPHLCRTLFRHAVTRLGKEVFLGSEIALVQNRPDLDFEKALKKYAKVHSFSYDEIEKATIYSHVIVRIGPKDVLSQIPGHAVVALFDTPYRLSEFSHPHIVVGYEDVFEAKEAVAEVLFGKIPALGKIPIRVYR